MVLDIGLFRNHDKNKTNFSYLRHHTTLSSFKLNTVVSLVVFIDKKRKTKKNKHRSGSLKVISIAENHNFFIYLNHYSPIPTIRLPDITHEMSICYTILWNELLPKIQAVPILLAFHGVMKCWLFSCVLYHDSN